MNAVATVLVDGLLACQTFGVSHWYSLWVIEVDAAFSTSGAADQIYPRDGRADEGEGERMISKVLRWVGWTILALAVMFAANLGYAFWEYVYVTCGNGTIPC